MRKWKLPPFENVGAGLTAIMPRIPQGEVFHAIILKLGGTFTKAQIDQIKIRLGGKVIWDITGSHLDSICSYLGFTANASYLTIPFAEFNARTALGENIGAIDTANFTYSGFSLEVKVNSGATSPTLEAWAVTTPVKNVAQPEHLPLMRVMVPSTHNKAAAGEYNLPFPLGSTAGALIKRLHLFHANLTQFNVKMNGVDLLDNGELGVVEFFQDLLTRTTQSGLFVFDPLVRDNQSAAIPTLKDANGNENSFQFLATLSAADTITAYSELYAPIGSV